MAANLFSARFVASWQGNRALSAALLLASSMRTSAVKKFYRATIHSRRCSPEYATAPDGSRNEELCWGIANKFVGDPYISVMPRRINILEWLR